MGLEFYIALTVYNNAGHFITVLTDTFKIPSKYPPGQAVVKDIDPDFINATTLDINVHFKKNILCGTWSGFKHHESVAIEIGIGTNNRIDNVVDFHHTNKTQKCITSPNIKPSVKYYFLVRSTCSGGQTLSSSNGVVIYPERVIQSSLNVRVGCSCLSNPKSELTFQSSVNGSFHEYKPSQLMSIGVQYLFTTENNVISKVFSNDSDVQLIVDNLYGSAVIVIPYVTKPSITIWYNTSAPNRLIPISECQNDKFILNLTDLSTFWYQNSTSVFSLSYQAAIVSRKGIVTSLVTSYERTDTNISHVFNGLLLKPNMKYQIAVRPCSLLQCQSPVLSAEFEVDVSSPTGRITFAELSIDNNKDCFDLHLQWEEFESDSGVLFYQWILSKVTKARNNLIDWTTFKENNQSMYLVSNVVTNCIDGLFSLPVLNLIKTAIFFQKIVVCMIFQMYFVLIQIINTTCT